MKLNKKGFTIIESVITFMVIAIAGSMLILGIFNIVNLFVESSTIKTDTNRLYNELVNGSDTIKPGTDSNMEFEFADGTESSAAFKDYYVEVSHPILIKLFAFSPAKKAEMLPGETQQPEEPKPDFGDLDAEYKVATKLSDVVYQYSERFSNTNKFNFYEKIGSETNAVKDNQLGTDNVFTSDVHKYFNSQLNPNKDIINGGVNKIIDLEYRNLIGNSRKMKWVYISYHGSSIAHTNAIVLGYYVPEKTVIYITDSNNNVTIIPLPETGGSINPSDLPTAGDEYNVLNSIGGDTIEDYDKNEFIDLAFITDNSISPDAGIIFVKVTN